MIEVEKDDLFRMVMLLDAAQDALDAAAAAEKRRESGRPMRCITEQQRAETCRKFVAKMASKYELPLYAD